MRIKCGDTGVTAFSWQDSETLFVGHRDGTINRITTSTGTFEIMQRQANGPINDVLVLTNGKVIAASGDDWLSMEVEKRNNLNAPNGATAIHSWDSGTGMPGEASTEHKSQVNSLCRRHGHREYLSGSVAEIPFGDRESAIYRWTGKGRHTLPKSLHNSPTRSTISATSNRNRRFFL